MSYRERRKNNPDWPKRLGDWVGRNVTLTMQIRSNGGTVMEAGSTARVASTTCGKLHLRQPGIAYISAVDLSSVDLI